MSRETKLKLYRGTGAFDRAKASADSAEGHMVVGSMLETGEPVYFVLPSDTPDEVVQDHAFLARHGRPRSDSERRIAAMAARVKGRSLA